MKIALLVGNRLYFSNDKGRSDRKGEKTWEISENHMESLDFHFYLVVMSDSILYILE